MSIDGLKRLLSDWYKYSQLTKLSSVLRQEVDVDVDAPTASESADDDDDDEVGTYLDVLSPMLPYVRVVQRTSKLVGFVVLRLLAGCAFGIYYLANGTWLAVRRSRRPENYERSARVLAILARHKYDTLVNLNSASDFILLHRSFDHPRRVLADEASLYEIDDRQAVFVEAPPGVEVWRGERNAFHATAQLENAVRVVVMPIASFYRLADELGDPAGRLVFVANTARCGSTLVSQIYERSDAFVSLSEPTAINSLRRFVGREDEPAVRRHARAVVRALCKPCRRLRNFAVKITPNSTRVVPLLRRLYPDASFVFVYRDALPVCRSMYKIWTELPMGRLNIMLCKFAPRLYVPALNLSGYYDPVPAAGRRFRVVPGYGQGCLLWANVIGMYRRFRRSGIEMAAVKYEDLVADRRRAVERLFEYNGVPAACVEPALRAFDSDSQANSVLSMDALRRTRLPPFTDDMRRETDKICAFYDLPKIGEPCVLEGTITRQ